MLNNTLAMKTPSMQTLPTGLKHWASDAWPLLLIQIEMGVALESSFCFLGNGYAQTKDTPRKKTEPAATVTSIIRAACSKL